MTRMTSVGSAENTRENFFTMLTDNDIQKAHPKEKLTGLFSAENAFAD